MRHNRSESLTCPECGAALPHYSRGPSLPIGQVVSLIGGLGVVAAYFMPWFGMQGILLTGSVLSLILGSPNDVRRFLPGTSDAEVQALRALVYLFPASGALTALLVVLGALRAGLRGPLRFVVAISGLVPLVALLLGVSRLPAGSSHEVGLWLIGAGSLAVLLGVGLDLLLARRRA